MKSLFVLISVFFSSTIFAENMSVLVDDSFARSAIQQQRNSAAFMTLTNQSIENLALIKAESSVAKIVELHTHINDNGVMRMRPVKQIDLPAGKKVTLKPGGLHVMLLGLNQDLVIDENIDVTLTFNNNETKSISIPVKKVMPHMKKKHMMKH